MSSTEKTCTTAIVEEWDLMAFSAVRRAVDSHGTLYVVARVNSFEGNGNSESGRPAAMPANHCNIAFDSIERRKSSSSVSHEGLRESGHQEAESRSSIWRGVNQDFG